MFIYIIAKQMMMNRKLSLTIRKNNYIQMKHVTSNSFLTKLSIVFTLTVVVFSGQNAAAQEVITIQQAVENTLKNNLQIKQAQFSAAISDENLTQSRYALLPTKKMSLIVLSPVAVLRAISGILITSFRYNTSRLLLL